MEIFKMLVTADWHLSNSLPHARFLKDGSGMTDRFDSQIVASRHIAGLAKKHKVDVVVIVGDLYDKRTVDALTLRHSISALVEFAPVSVLVVPGNHEAHSEGGEHYLPEYFKEIGHEHISFFGFEDVVEPRKWVALHSLPYASPTRALENLAALQAQIAEEDPMGKKRHILFAHVPIQGASVGSWKSDVGLEPAFMEQRFDRVFLGHYHVPQVLTPSCECVGSPWQLNFGEEGIPGEVLIVTLREDGEATLGQRIPIFAPQFHTVRGFDEAKVEEVVDRFRPGDFVRVVAEVTHAEFVELKASCLPFREALEEQGTHFKLVHSPVYHHEDRLGREPESVLSLEEMVSNYPNLATPGELPVDQLSAMGLEFLRQAGEAR